MKMNRNMMLMMAGAAVVVVVLLGVWLYDRKHHKRRDDAVVVELFLQCFRCSHQSLNPYRWTDASTPQSDGEAQKTHCGDEQITN